MIGAGSTAGAAVKHDGRLAVRIAGQLPIEAVTVSHVEVAGLVGLEVRIEGPALLRKNIPQKLNSS
jgi:hypothetical protein